MEKRAHNSPFMKNLKTSLLSPLVMMVVMFSSPGFFLADAAVNQEPNVPKNPSPANEALNISYDSPLVLSWTGGDPDRDTVTYDLYFGKYDADEEPPLLTQGLKDATFTVSAAREPFEFYMWKVLARDSKGAETLGETWIFLTSTPPSPDGPTELKAVPASINQIALSWLDNSENEDAFLVERKEKGGQFVFLDGVLSDVTNYTDHNAIFGKTYVYRVYAISDSLFSEYSNEVEITIPSSVEKPDLFAELLVHPIEAEVGEVIRVEFGVKNIGVGTVSLEGVSVKFDPGSDEFGTEGVSYFISGDDEPVVLNKDESYSFSIDELNSGLPWSYSQPGEYIIAVTIDIRSEIPETVETNNTIWSDISIVPASASPVTTNENIDSDGDGLFDWQEQSLGTNSYQIDSDNDGLNDMEEFSVYLTNPLDPDSDNDGYLDGNEVANGYDPLGSGRASAQTNHEPSRTADADSDGLTDFQESQYKTDPNDSDSDHDGYQDGQEVNSGYSPLGFGKIPPSDAHVLSYVRGRIVLAVEQHGEAFYVDPVDGRAYYLGFAQDAFRIMRERSLGISESDLAKIPISGSGDQSGDIRLQKRLS